MYNIIILFADILFVIYIIYFACYVILVTSFSKLKEDLESGFRLEVPSLCSRGISDLMQECWLVDPDDRPSFSVIKEILQNEADFQKDDSNNGADLSLDNLHYSTIIFDTEVTKKQFTYITSPKTLVTCIKFILLVENYK